MTNKILVTVIEFDRSVCHWRIRTSNYYKVDKKWITSILLHVCFKSIITTISIKNCIKFYWNRLKFLPFKLYRAEIHKNTLSRWSFSLTELPCGIRSIGLLGCSALGKTNVEKTYLRMTSYITNAATNTTNIDPIDFTVSLAWGVRG